MTSTPYRKPGDLFGVEGRVAIVTGASSGLGNRFVRVLEHAGARVVAVARRADRLASLAEAHPGVLPYPADVTDEVAMQKLIDDVVQRFGGLDVLINNAGAGTPAPATSEKLSDFRATLELNLVAVFNLARLAAVPMLTAKRGAIINIASIYGLASSWPISNSSYTSSKAAVINLTRELGCQWATDGVRVNAIAPGFFPSESTQDMTSVSSGNEFIVRRTPMRRLGTPDELDGAVLFLASDASTFMTGQTIVVDGGWSAH